MKNKKKKFLIDEINLFYIKMNASKHTIEYISEKLGCDCLDIVEIYNESKKLETNYQIHSGTVSMTEKQSVSDDNSIKKDENINYEFLEKYKNTRHKL